MTPTQMTTTKMTATVMSPTQMTATVMSPTQMTATVMSPTQMSPFGSGTLRSRSFWGRRGEGVRGFWYLTAIQCVRVQFSAIQFRKHLPSFKFHTWSSYGRAVTFFFFSGCVELILDSARIRLMFWLLWYDLIIQITDQLK